MCKHGADYGRDRVGQFLHRRSPSDSQVRMAWRTKIRHDTNNAKLKGLVNDLESYDRYIILSAKNTGS